MNLSSVLLSVDRVRCQEIYFQPSLIGVEQQGLVDMIKLSAKGLDKSLLQNIILIGGGAKTQGIKYRLERDLISEFDCPINVQISNDPIFGTWMGMKMRQHFKLYLNKITHIFTKLDYFYTKIENK